MTKRRVAQLMATRMSAAEAKKRHEELMTDPEYAAKWNALTAALFGVLADIPADALPEVADTNGVRALDGEQK